MEALRYISIWYGMVKYKKEKKNMYIKNKIKNLTILQVESNSQIDLMFRDTNNKIKRQQKIKKNCICKKI